MGDRIPILSWNAKGQDRNPVPRRKLFLEKPDPAGSGFFATSTTHHSPLTICRNVSASTGAYALGSIVQLARPWVRLRTLSE